MLHEELSGKILNAFYTVYNCLGDGFLENFGPKPQFIRRIFTNDKKANHE